MKKLLALLLAAALITLSTGCSGNKAPDADNDQIDNNTDLQTDVKEDTEAITEEDTEEIIEETAPSRGTISGDVYENDYLGFKFTKPESWVYSTDEEIAAIMNVSADMLGADYETILENNVAVWDMMARDTLTNTNISVCYENLELTFASNITEEQYIEALKLQLAGVADMTVNFSDDIDTVTLGGTEFTRGICETTMSGVDMTQVYYLHKEGTYMTCVVVTLVSGYEIADVEAMFE